MELFPKLPTTTNEPGGTPAVSVITRTKNRALFLRRCCQSILDQKFQDWHHTIVNDGGNPKDVEEVVASFREAYRGRVTVIHNPESLGMEAASNVGIRACQSPFVSLLDDDDTLHEDFLRECHEYLTRSPQGKRVAGVFTHTEVVQEEITAANDIQVVDRKKFNQHYLTVSLFEMAMGNVFTNNAFLFRKSVWDALGGFNEALPVCGDWEFNLRVLRKWEAGLIPKTLAYYHHRSTNVDHTSEYANTVIAASDSHRYYRNLIRHQFLREDFESGKVGLGHFLSSAYGFHYVESSQKEFGRTYFDDTHLYLNDIHAKLDLIKGYTAQSVKTAQRQEAILDKARRFFGAPAKGMARLLGAGRRPAELPST